MNKIGINNIGELAEIKHYKLKEKLEKFGTQHSDISKQIILQSQSKFIKTDNTHTIGCKNAKLSAKLSIEAIKYLQQNPKYKGKKIFSKKSNIFYKKDFNKKIINKINIMIQKGLVKNYCLNKKKIKIIKLVN